VQNLTISEYNAQVEDDDNEGMFLVDVEHHKTAASHGPARLFMNSRINSIMKVYLNTIRRHTKPQCKAFEERFFLSHTGNELKNISEFIQSVATRFNIETPTATTHRKVVSSESRRQKKSMPDISAQMTHSLSTSEKFYQTITYEQSFAARDTIEELACGKFFTKQQDSAIIKEWPLQDGTIPLSLCRQLAHNYKVLANKSDRQIQDRWKNIKKKASQ